MRLSVILVHYHTPALAARAVASLRAGFDADGIEGEVLVVDNGSDEAGRALLAGLDAHTLDAGGNRGFAGGANLGLREARGDLLAVMNPDVEILPGCLRALVVALEEGDAAIAGPRFYWDRERRFLLPPTERRTRLAELAAVLAQRGEGWARRARRRWRRHARRHWQAQAPLPSHDLSGGLLAFRRSAWEANGPFDEGYLLYFEETDWLLRAKERGLLALYVPGAEAVHEVGASAGLEPQARRWFEESAARFRRRRYGETFASTLEALAARRVPGQPEREEEPARRSPFAAPLDLSGALSARPDSAREETGGSGSSLWIELSPQVSGFPATGERLPASSLALGAAASWRLPEEIRERWTRAPLYLRVVDGMGRELEAVELVPEAPAPSEPEASPEVPNRPASPPAAGAA